MDNESNQTRLAKLIADDPFRSVAIARPVRTAKRKRRLTAKDLRTMGEACAAEYSRIYGEG